MLRQQHLTTVMTGATAAMIALTGCALYLVEGLEHLWPMLLGSSCATLLVMSLLHADLHRLWSLLRSKEDQALREARIDALTGLHNRKYLLEMIQARLGAGATTALLLFDLNHFKRLNDTRGHQAGDSLLIGIARRLELITPEATIARLGGDEFALLIDLSAAAELRQACERVMTIFDDPFELLPGCECFASVSLGAAMMTEGLDVSQVLRRADVALYRAKSENVRIEIFDDAMIAVVERRARLADDLRRVANSRKGLSTVFQPIASRDGDSIALETLLRWEHPQMGKIAPEEMVSVADEVHLINQLGLFVAEQACVAALRAPRLSIAINVTAVQLLDRRFASDLQQMVSAWGVSPDRLQIEVKEADITVRGSEMTEALAQLRAAGFVLAVDDYGSSSSSLAHLRRLGVSVLKLHPSILRNAREIANISVMHAKVELAKALGMKVICKGVGTEADRATALQAGCDGMQGYLFSHPGELEAILANKLVAQAA